MRRGPGIALPLLAGALLVALILVAILRGGGSGAGPAVSSPSVGAGFDGAALPAGSPPRDFELTDQLGRPVGLRDYRGRAVVLTFLYSTCGASCIVIAQQIRGALDELRHPPPVLIVSANPAADSRSQVRRFLQRVSLDGRVRYLNGPPTRLRAIWREYGVTPASAGPAAFARHASVILLDRHGSERVLFQQEQLTPESLAHDIGKLETG